VWFNKSYWETARYNRVAGQALYKSVKDVTIEFNNVTYMYR